MREHYRRRPAAEHDAEQSHAVRRPEAHDGSAVGTLDARLAELERLGRFRLSRWSSGRGGDPRCERGDERESQAEEDASEGHASSRPSSRRISSAQRINARWWAKPHRKVRYGW
jgi:hypothetical protein